LCAKSGRPISEVAEQLRIGKSLRYSYRREYHQANGQYEFPENGIEVFITEQLRIRELEKKLRDTEMQREI